ncbi:MAG: beta-RFAP synthase [Planctomycetia bacterium]|nr:beta-RFAP synthase [Planctomycetia bacterium]
MTRVTVRTPSRLHFGLLGWGGNAPRQFGGVGLMVEAPGLELAVETAPRWEASGPLSERTLQIARDVASRLEKHGTSVNPVRLVNRNVPDAHVGLGVGTQLSLAVARALTELAGLRATPVSTLARLTGRGRRSGIGIHGFAEGGLIVDAGRRGDQDVPTRLVGIPFPREWWVLIVQPGQVQGLHGPEELKAFRTLPSMPERTSERLCRLVMLGLLPAVLEGDLKEFGVSLGEIQWIVGAAFAPVQGGCYRNPRVEMLSRSMNRLGLHGVGQSSWGPTLYGFSQGDPTERERHRRSLIREFEMQPEKLIWTNACNTGATVEMI